MTSASRLDTSPRRASASLRSSSALTGPTALDGSAAGAAGFATSAGFSCSGLDLGFVWGFTSDFASGCAGLFCAVDFLAGSSLGGAAPSASLRMISWNISLERDSQSEVPAPSFGSAVPPAGPGCGSAGLAVGGAGGGVACAVTVPPPLLRRRTIDL